MSMATVFAIPHLAWFFAARLLLALAGLERATASLTIWFLAFAFAVAVVFATTWAIHRFIIHTFIVIEVLSPH